MWNKPELTDTKDRGKKESRTVNYYVNKKTYVKNISETYFHFGYVIILLNYNVIPF